MLTQCLALQLWIRRRRRPNIEKASRFELWCLDKVFGFLRTVGLAALLIFKFHRVGVNHAIRPANYTAVLSLNSAPSVKPGQMQYFEVTLTNQNHEKFKAQLLHA